MAVIDNHNASQDFIDNSNLRNGGAPARPFTQLPSSYGNPHIPVTSRNARDQETESFSRHASVGVQSSAAATSKKYDRWCFVCKDPNNKHTNPDSYKRHVRKHYAWYTCNVPKCIDKRFTRKDHLIKHLGKEHKVYDPRVVEQSKYTVDLKHLACGFCSYYCGSLDDLMRHVDIDHYRYLAQISDWKDDKVIWTLLSVNECWQEFLKAKPHLQESDFTWKNAKHVEELQRRLQEAKESAYILFREASDEVELDVSQHDYVESGLTRDGTDNSQSIQTFQEMTGALTPSSQSLEPSWVSEILNGGLGLNENVLSSPMDSETYESPTSVIDNDAGPFVLPSDLSDSRARFVHCQPLARPHAGLQLSASATWPTSSSLSSNRESSLLVYSNITSHPGDRPNIAAQGSYPEMRDRHDIDTHLDSNNQQRHHMQSLGHSQSQTW